MSTAPQPTRARRAKGHTAKGATNSVYEAASPLRRNHGWMAPTIGPNDSTLFELGVLRSRSRLAVRNDGYAKGLIDRLVTNIVGTGVMPLSLAEDRTFRKQLQALWLKWTDSSDAWGVLDWCGQQAQAARCWLEAGECFLRIRDRQPNDPLPVPMQIELLEPELCPERYNGLAPVTGNRIRAGIEFDQIGRRVAYYFWASRPGDFTDWNQSDLRRVPADHVLHLFHPSRPGMIRGLPHLTQVLVKLRELDKFDDATLLRLQLGGMFVAFLKKPASTGADQIGVIGNTPTTTENGRPVFSLQPGLFQELGPGEEVDFSEPPAPPPQLETYFKQQLRGVCAAAGVPYEVLTGDLSGVNDRSMRVLLGEFRRMIMCFQHQLLIYQVCRPVWDAWMDRVFAAGLLPIPAGYLKDPTPWANVLWQPHGWPYLHPVQDVEADNAAIRAGFTTRSYVVSEQGDDAEVVDQQQAEDNARADRLKLKYDSDGRQQKSAGSAADAPIPTSQGGGL
jgi:lambda family phage portal protein